MLKRKEICPAGEQERFSSPICSAPVLLKNAMVMAVSS